MFVLRQFFDAEPPGMVGIDISHATGLPTGTVYPILHTAIDIRIMKTPVRAPRANVIAERFVGTIRRELLDRILILNRRHAAVVLREFEGHNNNGHRPHRTLSQAAPSRPLPHCPPAEIHKIQRHDRLGGILHEYQEFA